MAHTHTSTYTTTTPANPYLACSICGKRVTHWLDKPGPLTNEPCGHQGDYTDTCPSWSPVDGCRCVEHLGERPAGHLPDPEA